MELCHDPVGACNKRSSLWASLTNGSWHEGWLSSSIENAIVIFSSFNNVKVLKENQASWLDQREIINYCISVRAHSDLGGGDLLAQENLRCPNF